MIYVFFGLLFFTLGAVVGITAWLHTIYTANPLKCFIIAVIFLATFDEDDRWQGWPFSREFSKPKRIE